MVDLDFVTVSQQDPLAPVHARDDVDRLDTVVDDLDLGGGGAYERLVEPLQVLAHQPTREVVVRRDLAPGRADHAVVADPAVTGGADPLVEPDGIGGRRSRVLPRIQGDLAARRVEDEVVGLVDGVHTRAGGARLDDVDPDGLPLRARTGDDALEEAKPPRAQPDDRNIRQKRLLHLASTF